MDVPICVNNIHEEALAFARVCLGRIRLEFKNLAGGEVLGIFAGEPGAVSLVWPSKRCLRFCVWSGTLGYPLKIC